MMNRRYQGWNHSKRGAVRGAILMVQDRRIFRAARHQQCDRPVYRSIQMRSGVLNHTFGHFGQLAPCRAQFREGKFQMLLRVVVLLFFRFAAECLQVAVDRDTKAIDLTYDRSDLVNSFGFHCSISS
jgi:hypothetical protein